MYLKATVLVDEDDYKTLLNTEENDNLYGEEDIEVKEVHYEKKYSQDEICEDAKKEVFDMEKNASNFYKHIDSGGFF